MYSFEEKDYKVFDLFQNQWALVTAGGMERFNSCTASWGSLGTLWTRPGRCSSVVTVYLHPARHTCELLRQSAYFTVSFYPEEYRKALAYMGSHSGRDGDKAAACGLSPVGMGEGVTYAEAELSFLCRKLYQHPFAKEDLAPEVQEYYSSHPQVYPPDENGEWQPHWIFVGEIVGVEDRR